MYNRMLKQEKMKTTNKGIHMTEEDIEALLARKEEALAKQQERKEKLDRTIENTTNDIEQLRYTLKAMKHIREKKRKRTFIRRSEVPAFFAFLSCFFDRIQHHLHRMLNNTWFCILVNARFGFESYIRRPYPLWLVPATVLGYFKRERSQGEF